MEWFIAVLVIAILGVAAVVAAGRMGAMEQDPVRDTFRHDLPTDRPLTATDLQTLRFGVAPRGYVMSQVDELLERLSHELAAQETPVAPIGDPQGTFPEPVEGAADTRVQPEGESVTETAHGSDIETAKEHG